MAIEILAAELGGDDLDLATAAEVAFEPALTESQVQERELTYEEDWGVSRRMTLYMLTRSRQQLIDGFKGQSESDTLFELLEVMQGYEQHLSALKELTNAAIARLLVVGSATVGAPTTAQPQS